MHARRALPALIVVLAASLLAAGCGDDDQPVESGAGRAAPGLTPAELTVDDSCGSSFVMRDAAGTQRLTITAGETVREDGAEPGTYELGAGGWTGRLEVGSGLMVWPCHDIASDFEGEQVDETWEVVGGQVELTSQAPPVEPGGMPVEGPVTAVAESVVLESPDGETAELTDVELVSDDWGFMGG